MQRSGGAGHVPISLKIVHSPCHGLYCQDHWTKGKPGRYRQAAIRPRESLQLRYRSLHPSLQENAMTPTEFVTRLGKARASAILRTDVPDVAIAAMEAAVRGGFTICEFTLTIPDALDVIREFSQRYPDVVVGAGTVLEVDQAHQAVEAGARFLVSPVVDETVIKAANELNVAAMPGTHTATEMLTAFRAGAPLQKLFPAPGIGPDYVKACLGPMPFLKLVPTHGVNLTNARDWLAAGAYAIGFVAPLFDPALVADRRFDELERRARQLLQSLDS
ncbi:MAG: bifunctional 4-hydroxy-2-oxoglutarate aldolase/2-dehydro-3-deoxy-phosphogluconate aldolase [Wenzhouxiangella sp.]|nr:MAG: bifunctional 4-hydroxy-2-oxoglutarate aldolase/2-dehydro-3-deoxy-phosphogluconate aldolase [Wenzhouxiangella sp.]